MFILVFCFMYFEWVRYFLCLKVFFFPVFPDSSSPACSWMWDNLTCWQAANVGEVVVVNCPEFIHDYIGPDEGEQRPSNPVQRGFFRNSGSFLSHFRNGEGQPELHRVWLVWAFPSLRGRLFPLWQHHQTCRFISSKKSTTESMPLTFLSSVVRTCTMHRLKLCTRLDTALLWSPWPQLWPFSAGSGQLLSSFWVGLLYDLLFKSSDAKKIAENMDKLIKPQWCISLDSSANVNLDQTNWKTNIRRIKTPIHAAGFTCVCKCTYVDFWYTFYWYWYKNSKKPKNDPVTNLFNMKR